MTEQQIEGMKLSRVRSGRSYSFCLVGLLEKGDRSGEIDGLILPSLNSYRIMSDGVKLQRGSCNLSIAGSFLKLRLC